MFTIIWCTTVLGSLYKLDFGLDYGLDSFVLRLLLLTFDFRMS